jgi:hypothetical protein
MTLKFHKTYLSQKITKQESNKRSTALCNQRLLLKSTNVSIPSRNSSSSSQSRVSEERRLSHRSLLVEGRRRRKLRNFSRALDKRTGGLDSKSGCGNAGKSKEDGAKLHGS